MYCGHDTYFLVVLIVGQGFGRGGMLGKECVLELSLNRLLLWCHPVLQELFLRLSHCMCCVVVLVHVVCLVWILCVPGGVSCMFCLVAHGGCGRMLFFVVGVVLHTFGQ